jgi:hypothetical protein
MELNNVSEWVIEFEDDGGKFYAGLADGAWGFAPTTETAEVFATEEVARRLLTNAYSAIAIHLATIKELPLQLPDGTARE